MAREILNSSPDQVKVTFMVNYLNTLAQQYK